MDVVHEPARFEEMEESRKQALTTWVKDNFLSRKTINVGYESHKLKDLFESSPEGFTILNGEFKGAMIDAGFRADNLNKINTRYNISHKSPALNRI